MYNLKSDCCYDGSGNLECLVNTPEVNNNPWKNGG